MATGRITGNAYYDKITKAWFFQINIPASLSPDGQRHRPKTRGPRHGVNFRTKGEALEAMDQRLREMHAGKIDFSGRMTLAEFVGAWAEHQRDEIPGERIAKYRYTVETYITPWLGSVRLGDVADRLKAHYRQLLRAGKHQSCCYLRTQPERRGNLATCKSGKPLSTITVQHVHVILRSMLSLAVELHLFTIHPMTRVKAPAAVKREITPWSAADAQRAIEVLGSERLGLAWIIAIMAGLRRGELAGLRWQDVDIDARKLRVVSQRTRVHTTAGTEVVIKPPKGTSKRSITMTDTVATLLTEHRHRQRVEGLENGYGRPEYVFVDGFGEPYAPQSFYRLFQKACTRHGLPVVRLHDLRHTFATLLSADGVTTKTIQTFLGHASARTTEDIYIHFLPEVGAEAIAALDRKIGKSA
ncbi:tyrosine-type recombinase/integrase [Frankia tisae]|uniref:tyrosine-type recombinase/integrase n=1 Tax=Frankia tisae TaxID=2950104 RepID=UPI0021C03EC4|nr:site-specific integrase [Frankia tisae]